MNDLIVQNLLLFYGLFLICCGITAVTFIGLKAKTALVSGGTSGCIALLISYLVAHQISWAKCAGLVLAFGLFIVFSWRVTKTLFSIFDMIPTAHPDTKGKGIAFLIIGLMAVVSLVVFCLQFLFFNLG
ncbi:MAG TPA: hypothetical protein VK766_06040 [Cytophagaceae bacterium]|jgi:hypothetical protein|nr:hypothetical protein [Cytophagaceae bacterium]